MSASPHPADAAVQTAANMDDSRPRQLLHLRSQPLVEYRRPHPHVIGEPFAFRLPFQEKARLGPDFFRLRVMKQNALSADGGLSVSLCPR